MKTSLKILLCAALALGLSTLTAATAGAEYYVPPENSAVNQYTQTIPSAGGDKSGESKEVSAAEALGEKNAKRLQKQGPEGAAAAELAAETAPAPVEESAPTEEGATTPPADPEAQKKDKKHGAKHKGDKGKQKKRAGGATGGGKPAAPNGTGNGTAGETAKGGSAVGELASQATGLSGGTLGIFLPLVIVAAIIWAGAYLWRRQNPAGSGPLPR